MPPDISPVKSEVPRLRALLLSIVSAISISAINAQSAAAQSPIVGIDHISLAVSDLDHASSVYRQLGFTLKAGRAHTNGVRNNHVKFRDGSGIELITAGEPMDPLATRYVNLLRQGDGPAYISFHARNTSQLIRALKAAKIGYSEEEGLVTLQDPELQFMFFVRDNRADSDRPEHFAHPNSATAMTEVWIAVDDPARFSNLFAALGIFPKIETAFVPEPSAATIFEVENGKVILLAKSRQLIAGRPVIGATFQVANVKAVADRLSRSPSASSDLGEERLVVPPAATHGIWLEFRVTP